MLRNHLKEIETILLAQSRAASNAGHPNLRGGPREWFIRDFLETHLPATLQIGQGEIIDSDSEPSPHPTNYRPQVDIILYRKDLPIISLSKNDFIFFAEGVMATIEVKSILNKKKKGSLEEACESIVTNKKLNRGLPTMGFGRGWRPDHIVSYVIAFDGPAKVSTVANWLSEIADTLNCEPIYMPEMILILGKGTLWRINAFPFLKYSKVPTENNVWAYVQESEYNLFRLFVHMLSWMGWTTPPPNVDGYIKNISEEDVSFI